MINYSRLPKHVQFGMEGYIEHGIKPGDFLCAFLSNDLMGAMGRADTTNRHYFFEICLFLHNEAPAASYGSPEKFNAWLKKGGMEGRTE